MEWFWVFAVPVDAGAGTARLATSRLPWGLKVHSATAGEASGGG